MAGKRELVIGVVSIVVALVGVIIAYQQLDLQKNPPGTGSNTPYSPTNTPKVEPSPNISILSIVPRKNLYYFGDTAIFDVKLNNPANLEYDVTTWWNVDGKPQTNKVTTHLGGTGFYTSQTLDKSGNWEYNVQIVYADTADKVLHRSSFFSVPRPITLSNPVATKPTYKHGEEVTVNYSIDNPLNLHYTVSSKFVLAGYNSKEYNTNPGESTDAHLTWTDTFTPTESGDYGDLVEVHYEYNGVDLSEKGNTTFWVVD